MATPLQTLPDGAPDWGTDFNYSLWTPNTVLTLCNVPWNSDYRDIVKFDSQAALDAYINTAGVAPIQIQNATMAKFGQPISIDAPFNVVQRYNYIRATNGISPIAGDVARSFYYFIQDVVYVAPDTTRIYVQLDVWQSFGYGITFGNSYIERGHIGIANENQFDDHGRTYLTTPEGLDVGGEYRVIQRWERNLADARAGLGNNFSVMVCTTTSFTEPPLDSTGKPNLVMAHGSLGENLPNGCSIYVFQAPIDFYNFVNAMKTYPWVMQGIISITAMPKVTTYAMATTPVTIGGINALEVISGQLTKVNTPMQMNWRDNIDLGARYANLKKFLTFPYCAVEVTSYTGTPIILKPESWDDDDASIVEVPHLVPPNPRIAFVPHRYNADPSVAEESDGYGIYNDGGEWLDMATGLFNFPTFAVLTNQYLEYMAANTHGIAFSFQSADWSQQKALAGNQQGYDVTARGIQTSKDINSIANNAQMAQTALANQLSTTKAGVNAISGVGGAALDVAAGGAFGAAAAAGQAMSAVQGMVGNAIDVAGRNMGTAISVGASRASNNAATAQSAYANDTNKSLADWAAKGDYANTIAGINAKLQDAKLTQPSTAGQIGGDAFNLATSKMGYDVKVKMVSKAIMRQIGEIWLRYGYAVNAFGSMPSSLMVMDRFTYWKLQETYITGSACPEPFKQAIRGIFEKGVTVWKNPSDIGTIDWADNNPLTGVSY